MTRPLVVYRDLDTYLVRPAAGDPSGLGWWRQAGHNISTMFLVGRPELGVDPLIQFTPTFTDVTAELGVGGSYLRVGTICYLWAFCPISGLGTDGAGMTGMPVPPADSVLPQVVGHGYLRDNSAATDYPIVVINESGAFKFYFADAATDGAVINADPVTVASGDRIVITCAYRVGPPPEGRLADETYSLST